MRRIAVMFCSLPILCMTLGCSSDLSRRQAKNQIDAMLEPHEVTIRDKKVTVKGQVPGFELPDHDDSPSTTVFHLDTHKEYGSLASIHTEKSPDSEDNLVNALGKIGYVTVQQEGPMTKMFYGHPITYTHSRTVRFTPKVGSPHDTGYSRDYSTKFSCYPQPDFSQCNLPPLLEQGSGYSITGIVQDGTHAKVNLLIPWKLTPFAVELRPFALAIQQRETKLDESPYYTYAELYAWEHFLNAHAPTGSSPATVLFQKFDDGWRIVDEAGKSEKDFSQPK
jgi:hypothetical protein